MLYPLITICLQTPLVNRLCHSVYKHWLISRSRILYLLKYCVSHLKTQLLAFNLLGEVSYELFLLMKEVLGL